MAIIGLEFWIVVSSVVRPLVTLAFYFYLRSASRDFTFHDKGGNRVYLKKYSLIMIFSAVFSIPVPINFDIRLEHGIEIWLPIQDYISGTSFLVLGAFNMYFIEKHVFHFRSRRVPTACILVLGMIGRAILVLACLAEVISYQFFVSTGVAISPGKVLSWFVEFSSIITYLNFVVTGIVIFFMISLILEKRAVKRPVSFIILGNLLPIAFYFIGNYIIGPLLGDYVDALVNSAVDNIGTIISSIIYMNVTFNAVLELLFQFLIIHGFVLYSRIEDVPVLEHVGTSWRSWWETLRKKRLD
ncbi:MAG: hypothetical protein ACFFCS_10380 [Candidatus Hodarchaeota archaeon]